MTLQAHRLLHVSFLTAFIICAVLLPLHNESRASDGDQPPDLATELKKLDLSQLMDIEVISVSKKLEKLSRSPAAIFVITQEDIRRSGATVVADLLRMVPGIQVARTGANVWRISSRGFLGENANRICVLIDGRYTDLFSSEGSMQIQDLVLEDIDRIEVIRGPGAAVWGTEAMTGVINIITKHAKDTQGGLASSAVGSSDERSGEVRYGGRLQHGMYYRVYAKYQQFGAVDYPMHLMDPEYKQTGFRLDWDVSTTDRLMFTGSYHTRLDEKYTIVRTGGMIGGQNETLKYRNDYSGGHLNGRWEHTFSPTSDMALQVFYDYNRGFSRYRSTSIRQRADASSDVYDIDFQHRFNIKKRHDIVWGFEFRTIDGYLENNPVFSFADEKRTDHNYSAFLQDEIEVIQDRVRLTLGSKFEYNSFCRDQMHPTIRLLWTPHPQHTFWAAASRAVRSNLRGEQDMVKNIGTVPDSPLPRFPKPMIVELRGSDSVDAEEMVSYETGYRLQPHSTVTFDITAFANRYDNLITTGRSGRIEVHPSYFILPVNLDNSMDGRSCGVEIAATWQVAAWWKLQSSYTHLNFNLDPGKDDVPGKTIAHLSPKNQFSLRSSIDITRQIEFDTNIYFTDRISGNNLSSYTNLTVRLAWKPVSSLELALIGSNLLDGRHTELWNVVDTRTQNEVMRSVIGKITWTF